MKAIKPRDLTEEEKKRPYAWLYYREPQSISALAKEVLDSGKMMDSKYAMTAENIREKTITVAPEEECGYCYLPGGGAYACGRHDMPGITVEMYRHWLYWWNQEKPEEAETRYKCWCPPAHHNSGFMWSSENIGDQVINLILTEPLADQPEKIGIDADTFQKAGLLMVDGANARQLYLTEDIDDRPIPTIVMHFLYDAPGGIIMRSHFWIGYQAMGGRLVNVVGDVKTVDEKLLRGLVEHNSLEMNYLCQMMPILWEQFRD